MLDHGVLNSLVTLLEEALERKDNTSIKQGTWALSVLCQGNPLPAYEKVADATPILGTIIKEVTDLEVCSDALRALVSFSTEKRKITRVLEADNIPSLVKYLEYNTTVK